MFGMLGIFAEREMIHARVVAGIERVRGEIQRNGEFTSKAGKIHERLGRPNADPKKVEKARQELASEQTTAGHVLRSARHGGSIARQTTPAAPAALGANIEQAVNTTRDLCALITRPSPQPP
jgi:hypothetical protein